MTEDRDLYLPGTVISYPYLWRWQSESGETEGRKARPVCVVVAVRSEQSNTHLMLLAISSQRPNVAADALEVPEIECRRGGLSNWKRAWITVSEYNYDIAERSFYLDTGQQSLGRFSRSFVAQLAIQLKHLLQAKSGRVERR
jgi:hypothetical protein